MDYLDLTLTTYSYPSLSAPSVSGWYENQTHTVSSLGPDQMAWLYAQGWRNSSVTYDAYGNASGTLTRTQIKPNVVLDDLVADYVDAYNDGREMNEQRYHDLMVMYLAVKGQTESELITLATDDDTFNGLIEDILTNISSDYTTASDDMENSLDAYGDSQRTAIATRFAARVAAARDNLVSKGMYNSTTWTVIEAGIDREEAVALAAVNDSIYEKQLSLKDRLYTLKTSMRDRILAARDRLNAVMNNNQTARTTIRNGVVQAMLNFVERRTDSYPDISSIGNIAAQLGAGSPNSFAP